MKRIILLTFLLAVSTFARSQNPAIKGYWKLKFFENGKTHLELKHRNEKDNLSVLSSDDIDLKMLDGYRTGRDVSFVLRNSQGRLDFTGDVDENGGSGTFKFFPDEGFRKGMIDRGYDDLKNSVLLLFTVKDFGVREVDEFKALGYQDMGHQIVAVCALEIDASYAKEIQEAGFPDIGISKIVAFWALGVDAERIREFKLTFGDMSVGDVTSFTALKIDPGYVREIKSTGLDIDPRQVISFKALGITPEYIKSFQNAGLGDIKASSFPALKSLEIDADFIQEVKSMGFNDVNVSKIIKLKVFKFDKEYVKMIRDAGYSNISLDDILQFKVMKIDADFIKKAREFNNGELPSPKKLVGLKAMEGSAHKH